MKKLAVIGRDVSKSASPELHAFIAKNMGLEVEYSLISIAEETFESRIEEIISELDGFNVTIPYKLSVIPHLRETVGDAAVFGAVNTVLCAERKGYNTDGSGFDLMLKNAGVEVKDRRVLVLGAGGAGRSAAKKLKDGGAEVFVYNRTYSKAQALADEFGIFALTAAQGEYDIVINATGVGMHESVGKSPVGEEILKNCQVAVDLIYEPPESEFLRIARTLGKKTVNGKAMLFYQAYFSECIYFGLEPSAQQAKSLFIKYNDGV